MNVPTEAIELLFNTLAAEASANSIAKGFCNEPAVDIALMHSELSEALEEIRAGHALNETYNAHGKVKPEGVPSELADVVIRILDFSGRHGINLGKAILDKMAYNATRPFRHGGKAL